MRRLIVPVMGVLAIFAGAVELRADNLVVNGSFEDGNLGFTRPTST